MVKHIRNAVDAPSFESNKTAMAKFSQNDDEASQCGVDVFFFGHIPSRKNIDLDKS